MASRGKSPGKGRGSWGRKKTRPRGGVSIKHSCGHTQVHQLTGLKWKKDREKVRLATVVCTTCWAAAKAEEAEILSGIEGLPDMVGTGPQILWARSIRGIQLILLQANAAKLDRLRRERALDPASERYMSLALPAVVKKTAAKWWIDHREDPDVLEQLLGKRATKAIDALFQEIDQAPLVIPVTEPPSDCPF